VPSGAGVRADYAAFYTLVHSAAVLLIETDSISAIGPIPEVIAEFRRFSPPDDRFREAFSKAQYNSNLIERARYCLEQLGAIAPVPVFMRLFWAVSC
jgi:hypothetical protein